MVLKRMCLQGKPNKRGTTWNEHVVNRVRVINKHVVFLKKVEEEMLRQLLFLGQSMVKHWGTLSAIKIIKDCQKKRLYQVSFLRVETKRACLNLVDSFLTLD